jgi:protein-tyrosine-phosphatase
MAAGWLRHLAGDAVAVFSAGSQPAEEINPGAVQAMAEVGIDISHRVPQPWTMDQMRSADVVVTMGCGEDCPVVPGRRYEDWSVADPALLDMHGVRALRDELKTRVDGLIHRLLS